MSADSFTPTGYLVPDWQDASNWSSGRVPGGGAVAVVNAAQAWLDPLTSLTAHITLMGGAELIGNQSAFLIAPGGALLATDHDALYANGAIVNQGVITAQGPAADLAIVVQAGSGLAASYGLTVASFENTGAIDVSAGATLDIGGTEFSNTGTVDIEDAALIVNGGWVDGGQSSLAPGGVITIGHAGLASFNEGVSNQDFEFTGPGTISFQDAVDVSNVAIGNFGYRDEILTNSVAAANSLLAGGLVFTQPVPAGEVLAVTSIATGAAIMLEAEAAPCFARGTPILTAAGYVAVEQIMPGDMLVTIDGGLAPVRWVGRRTVELAAHPRPEAVRPVSVAAHALAENAPDRPVCLSPDHALFLRGRLVPVKYLRNGVTIKQDTSCATISYFHLELDRHNIILAANLPVETYLDTGNRHMFANASGPAGAKPHPAPVFGRGSADHAGACAELCLAGPVLQAIRRELFARTEALGYRREENFRIDLLDRGRIIASHNQRASLAAFKLPAGHSGRLTLQSDTFIPAELSDATCESDDWRRLGIAIRRIKFGHQPASLSQATLGGLHPRGDGDSAQWTQGHAVIAVPAATRILGLAIQAYPLVWSAAG